MKGGVSAAGGRSTKEGERQGSVVDVALSTMFSVLFEPSSAFPSFSLSLSRPAISAPLTLGASPFRRRRSAGCATRAPSAAAAAGAAGAGDEPSLEFRCAIMLPPLFVFAPSPRFAASLDGPAASSGAPCRGFCAMEGRSEERDEAEKESASRGVGRRETRLCCEDASLASLLSSFSLSFRPLLSPLTPSPSFFLSLFFALFFHRQTHNNKKSLRFLSLYISLNTMRYKKHA